MYVFPMPTNVTDRLDAIARNFLLQGNCDPNNHKIHLVKWDHVTLSKKEGWLWRFVSQEQALWKDTIKARYGMEDSWINKSIAKASTQVRAICFDYQTSKQDPQFVQVTEALKDQTHNKVVALTQDSLMKKALQMFLLDGSQGTGRDGRLSQPEHLVDYLDGKESEDYFFIPWPFILTPHQTTPYSSVVKGARLSPLAIRRGEALSPICLEARRGELKMATLWRPLLWHTRRRLF
ncbi:hypothetical protein H5410_030792 [Solanum commersonii]|uniref:Uncharacterized protein n=1 Tax=Solanum commersonii TaxID=4109 RepID=A0A9J5YKE0_SOLCO|nr:hypothetical protein H5410_030792 [Solanum commersonii]